MLDPDAPGGTFTHWLAYGIPPAISSLAALPAGALEGINDFGRRGYGGPCPPRGGIDGIKAVLGTAVTWTTGTDDVTEVVLIAQDAYFAELAEGSPLLSALTPASGLLGKDYAKDVDAVSGEHLHIGAAGRDEGLWRVSLDAVDAWTAGAVGEDDKGPFARLLSA
jgi:hypothetical protein